MLERHQTNLRVAVMDRMDRLEDKLTAIRDDISVNLGAITHDREALESTRRDMRGLRERVDLMWRQIKRLEQQVRGITGEA
jgi:predicted  nucleic acid-binding Zn-ribbon protein